jgi:hypothetical protein
MHIDLRKTVMSVLGAIVCYMLLWKIIFFFFEIEELLLMLLVAAFVIVAYGIQKVEWSKDSSVSLFGLTFSSSTEFYSQYTLFGLYGITRPKLERVSTEYFRELSIPMIAQSVLQLKSLLPFGGYRDQKYGLMRGSRRK